MAGVTKTEKRIMKSSLTFQVVGLYWCVLILIFVINGLLVYRFSINQKILYYRQTAEYSAADLAEIMEELLPINWILNYWNEHPDAPSRAESTDIDVYKDVYDQMEEKYGFEWELSLTSSDIQSMSPEVQEALSKYYYEDIRQFSSYIKEEAMVVMKGPIIAGGRKGEPLRVFFNGLEGRTIEPGEVLNIPKDQLQKIWGDQEVPTLQVTVRQGGREKTVNGECCRIITGNSDLIGLVIVGVDEDYLKKQSTGAILHMIGIDLVISALLGFVLMQILYFLILRPVNRIQRGLHVYVENGDTDEVVKTMSMIRPGNEVGSLAGDIGNMVQALESHVRARQQLEDEQEKLAAELANAASIQAAMLPKVFPDRSRDPRLELYASMAPAKEVGGDLYDFFPVDQDHLALVIADVSGKGIPAALFMMEAKTLVREITAPGALEVNAGHTKPAICRCRKNYELVKNMHDLPLGIRDNLSFTVHEWQLEAGDRIFVYTDGINEAENDSGEQFGTDRMLAALNEKCEASQKETLAFVSDSVHAFAGTAPQADDMTMLGMTFYGS